MNSILLSNAGEQYQDSSKQSEQDTRSTLYNTENYEIAKYFKGNKHYEHWSTFEVNLIYTSTSNVWVSFKFITNDSGEKLLQCLRHQIR